MVSAPDLSRSIQIQQGRKQTIQQNKHNLDTSISTQEESITNHEKALTILQELESTWRGVYEEALAALGTKGLSAIWQKDIQVVLESSVKRGVANLDIVLVKEGQKVRIKGGSGGSIAQILTVILRILITTSSRPALRPLLALDEPFSQVAEEHRPALGQLLKELTSRLGLQLLFVSHERELADYADVVYEVKEDGKVVQVKREDERE